MSASGLPVQLSVPADPRFRTLVLSMTRRIAESVGLSTGEAEALGDEVADQASAAVRQAGADPATLVDVTFDLAGSRLRVRATCRGASFEVLRALPAA
ncbi:MAG: hypothetical protein ACM36C_03445 [Acidobacteriota bacterium]